MPKFAVSFVVTQCQEVEIHAEDSDHARELVVTGAFQDEDVTDTEWADTPEIMNVEEIDETDEDDGDIPSDTINYEGQCCGGGCHESEDEVVVGDEENLMWEQ